MLNKLGKEKMVYSEKVISIKVNDEVTWKSVDKGHNVEFIGMQKGVSKFKSKISKDAEVTSIVAVVDGQQVAIPLDPDNRHYAEILKQVKEGKLTIKEAE